MPNPSEVTHFHPSANFEGPEMKDFDVNPGKKVRAYLSVSIKADWQQRITVWQDSERLEGTPIQGSGEGELFSRIVGINGSSHFRVLCEHPSPATAWPEN